MDGTDCEKPGDCGGLKFAYMSKEDCMTCGWRPFERPQKEGIGWPKTKKNIAICVNLLCVWMCKGFFIFVCKCTNFSQNLQKIKNLLKIHKII